MIAPFVAARPIQPSRNRGIFFSVLAGALRALIVHPERRRRLLSDLWMDLRRAAPRNVNGIELSHLRGIESITVEGPVSRHCLLVLTALAALLDCDSIFGFGAHGGDAASLVAHNLPKVRIYTLERPQREPLAPDARKTPAYFGKRDPTVRFRDAPEAERITQLFGESTTFDFAPYSGDIDLVFIDASGDLRSDTEAAFGMLSELGTIVWDDYPHAPGVYAYLNEIGGSIDQPIFHILGTRLAVYSRWDIVVRGE